MSFVLMENFALQVFKYKEDGIMRAEDVEFFKKFNITEEDINFTMNFTALFHKNEVDNRFGNSAGEDYRLCYCNGTMRNVALMYRAIHGYTSMAICIFGVLANVFNVIVLTRKQMKNAPFAYILTWIAVVDMLLMSEYIPFAAYMYLTVNTKAETFSYGGAIAILIHTHLSQVLHTMSICLTLTLAFWRYNAVRYPEKSRILWTREKCVTMVRIALLLPIFICMPSYLMFSIQSTPVYEEEHTVWLYHLDLSELAKSNDETFYIINLWLYAVVIKLLPCIILAIISLSLVQALNDSKHRREKLQNPTAESKEKNTRLRKNNRKADRSSQMLVAILLLFLITEIPQCILGLLSGILGRCFFRNCYHLMGEIMDILALLNGAINFILYCSMSKQFRVVFSKIFRKIQISHNVSEVLETYI